MIRSCWARVTPACGGPNTSVVRVFTSTKTSVACASIAANQDRFRRLVSTESSGRELESHSAEDSRAAILSPFRPSVKCGAESRRPTTLGQKSNGKENTSEQPARTSADESDKVRESVSFQGAPAFHSLCSGRKRIVETRYAMFSSYGLA